MTNNLIEKLKEKKKVMKLLIAALAGAMTVCGGAALYSVSAVKPEGNVEVSTAAQTKEDVVQERYNKVQEVIEENREENDTTIVDKLFETLGDINDDDLAEIQRAKENVDQEVMKYISMMRVVKFCRDYGGICDLDRRTIEFRGGLFNMVDIVALRNILKDDNVFWSLKITFGSLSDEVVKQLSEELEVDGTLIRLELVRSEIGDKGVRVLSEGLKTNTTLTSLYFRNNGIGDEGARELSEVLKTNTTLTSLNLSDNGIRDEGARALSEALKGNTTLVSLGFESYKMGDEGEKALCESLQTNTALTKLEL